MAHAAALNAAKGGILLRVGTPPLGSWPARPTTHCVTSQLRSKLPHRGHDLDAFRGIVVGATRGAYVDALQIGRSTHPAQSPLQVWPPEVSTIPTPCAIAPPNAPPTTPCAMASPRLTSRRTPHRSLWACHSPGTPTLTCHRRSHPCPFVSHLPLAFRHWPRARTLGDSPAFHTETLTQGHALRSSGNALRQDT